MITYQKLNSNDYDYFVELIYLFEDGFVQADLVDDYALDFYRSTGGMGGDVVHFSYPLN